MSPYKAAKLVNKWLVDDEINKILPPQMFYTYVSKGYIKSTNRLVEESDLSEWYQGYKTRYLAKVS
jgi:hypothetical protein